VQSTEEQQNHAQIGNQKVDDIEAHIQQEISLPQTTSLSLFQLYYVTTREIQLIASQLMLVMWSGNHQLLAWKRPRSRMIYRGLLP